MAALCMNYNFFLLSDMQAHSGCFGNSNHEAPFPDLSPCPTLRREVVGSAPAAIVGRDLNCLNSSFDRRPSLPLITGRYKDNNNNNNNSNSYNSDSDHSRNFFSGYKTQHLLLPEDDKAHSNMFSFQNCTLQSEAARDGDSYWVSFEEKSFCKGRAFKVYSGKMNGRGRKAGDRCVVKVFRKCRGTKSLCSCEMKKSEQARELARLFNKSAQKRNVFLRFAATYWAHMDEVSRLKTIFFSGERPLSSTEAVMFEDDVRIDGERPNKSRRLSTFMDCRGRHGSSRATELDAFTHFCYHATGGKLVVCGLEGVHDSEGFFLKTPTIHSRAREFGNSDGGLHGIREVFRHHVCTSVCKDMRKPPLEDDECDKSESASAMAECATSGIAQALRENSHDSSVPSKLAPETCAIDKPQLFSPNSKVSLMSNFSDNSLDNREIPSAPELPFEDHSFARSLSCPPPHMQISEAPGACWISRDRPEECIAMALENSSMIGPRITYIHQNSTPNFLSARDAPVCRSSATLNMNDLHVADENANLRRLVTDGCAISAPEKAAACEPSGVTFDLAGATASTPTTSSRVSHLEGNSSMDTSYTGSSVTSPITPQGRPRVPRLIDPDLHTPGACASNASDFAQPAIPIRQISTPSSSDCPPLPHPVLPDNPPSYIDSQIATAVWVIQRGYGSISPTASPSLPWYVAHEPSGAASTPNTNQY